MGFGRIGKNIFRILHGQDDIQVVGISDIAEPKATARTTSLIQVSSSSVGASACMNTSSAAYAATNATAAAMSERMRRL